MLDLDCLEIQVTCIVATPSLSLSITSGLTFNCSRLITSSLPIPPTISSSTSLSLTWSLSLIIDLQCSALNLKIWVNIYICVCVCVCVCVFFGYWVWYCMQCITSSTFVFVVYFGVIYISLNGGFFFFLVLECDLDLICSLHLL